MILTVFGVGIAGIFRRFLAYMRKNRITIPLNQVEILGNFKQLSGNLKFNKTWILYRIDIL